ncbi:MAG: iron-containing redox enzyme family protein [Bdellovibrionales bacterium]|nr:iron-containing redox enzyme family protein [Ramlibacter sp.]
MTTTDYPENDTEVLARTPSGLRQAAAGFASRLLAHPFLERCRTGRIQREELDRFLVQHGKYSRHFTQYLCALISQFDNGADVTRLASNLAEELGFDEGTSVPHSRIYADMLDSFGLDLERARTLPQTQAFIDTMFTLCRRPGGLEGLAALCFGAEAVVPSLYSRIIEGFVSVGVDRDALAFFTIHVECDDGHADTMFEILQRMMAQSPTARQAAIAAGKQVVEARLRMFDALLNEQD